MIRWGGRTGDLGIHCCNNGGWPEFDRAEDIDGPFQLDPLRLDPPANG